MSGVWGSVIGALIGVFGVGILGMIKWVALSVTKRLDNVEQKVDNLGGMVWQHLGSHHPYLVRSKEQEK